MIKSILIIDDEIETLEVMNEFLDILGYVTTCVSSVDAALASIKVNKPDLILTDLIMPGGDGFSLIKKVKEYDPLIPIYIISGVCSKVNRDEAINQGADMVFSKPLNIIEFEDSLEKLFMVN